MRWKCLLESSGNRWLLKRRHYLTWIYTDVWRKWFTRKWKLGIKWRWGWQSSKRLHKRPVTRSDDFYRQVSTKTSYVKNGTEQDLNSRVILILYQNVHWLNNKLLELTVLLQSDLKNIEILRYTEHWQKEEKIKLSSIDEFKLVRNFMRNSTECAVSCMYIKNTSKLNK